MEIPLYIREYAAHSFIITIAAFYWGYVLRKETFFKWCVYIWVITTLAYFTYHPIVFFTLGFLTVRAICARETSINSLANYFLFFPIIPLLIRYEIPFPGINFLFTLTFPRILSLAILVPIFLKYIKIPGKKLFSNQLDKYLLIYFCYVGMIIFRDTSFTDAARSCLYIFLDRFLLYFALSRTIESVEGFKKIFCATMCTALFLSLGGILEALKHWHLYSGLVAMMNYQSLLFVQTTYAFRLDLLRAYGTFFNTIAFGMYFSAIIGMAVFLKETVFKKQALFYTTIILLIAASICTASRGAIVSYAVFFFFFAIFAMRKMIKMAPFFLLIIIIAAFLPITPKILSSLPFVGTDLQKTVVYRQRLWDNAIVIIKNAPLTGRGDFLEEKGMRELKHKQRGGRFLIDVVNMYLAIALRYGIIGVALFASICVKAVSSVLRRFFIDRDEESALLGKVIFSMTCAFAIMLFTTSTVSFFGFLNWILFGLCAAYTKHFDTKKTLVPNQQATLG